MHIAIWKVDSVMGPVEPEHVRESLVQTAMPLPVIAYNELLGVENVQIASFPFPLVAADAEKTTPDNVHVKPSEMEMN
jgi:hypothetical protein